MSIEVKEGAVALRGAAEANRCAVLPLRVRRCAVILRELLSDRNVLQRAQHDGVLPINDDDLRSAVRVAAVRHARREAPRVLRVDVDDAKALAIIDVALERDVVEVRETSVGLLDLEELAVLLLAPLALLLQCRLA